MIFSLVKFFSPLFLVLFLSGCTWIATHPEEVEKDVVEIVESIVGTQPSAQAQNVTCTPAPDASK